MRPLLRFFVPIVALSLVAAGCDDCSDSEPAIPESTDGRVDALTSTLPAETGVVAMTGDLESLESQGGNLESLVDRVVPASGALSRLIESRLGFNPLDGASLTEAGIAADAGAAAALVDAHPVVLAYVDDRQKFEKKLRKQVEQRLGIKGTPQSGETNGQRTKSISEKGVGQVAWSYDGKLAMVVFPAVLTSAEATPGTVSSTLSTLAKTDGDDSFGSRSGFRRFREATSDRASFAYVNTDWYFSDTLMERIGDRPSDARRQLYELFRRTFEGVGLAGATSRERLVARVDVGLDASTAEHLQKVARTDRKVDWTNLATDQTLLAFRTSFDLAAGWSAFMENAPETYRLGVRRLLSLSAPFDALDLEQIVAERLTGESALFFYGVGPNLALSSIGTSPKRALAQMGLVAGLQFDSPEALDETVQSLAALDDEFVHRSDIETKDGSTDESIQVLECGRPDGDASSKSDGGDGAGGGSTGSTEGEQNGVAESEMPEIWESCASWPVRAYADGDRLVVASTAISESSMQEYLEGTREASVPLTEAEGLDLGARLATEAGVSGLYLNVVRAAKQLGDKLPPVPTMQKLFDELQEALVTFELADQGLQFDLTVDTQRGGADPKSSSTDAGDE